MSNSNNDAMGVAIIGMSGRFPGARNLDEFWQNLRAGRESITVLDEATLLAAGVDATALSDPTYVRAAPILEDIELFDAPLFDIAPGEARLLDPQHRLFLECAWEALEHGGYRSAAKDLSIGVYGSTTMSSYLLNNLVQLPAFRSGHNGLNLSTLQVFVANDKDFLATRVAFKLDLRGPSYTVQSACSSSLLAVHSACQALLARECDLALAGGVSIKVPQQVGYFCEPGSIVSSDGHCRAFDAKGDGTVFGSGVGVVLLRRLEDALADGDHIWAVIRGSAANNDGSLKMGFTAPSIEAQARVIEEAINVAAVTPQSIGYVEAHGTGTNLGDPVEIAALTQAFRASTQRQQFCAIGSVKTNIGHLEGASGIAGLIKAALVLHHQEIPASLHFEVPNPQLDLEHSPFVVNTKLRPWTKTTEAPRRASVTSLGVGGTNVHVVLEEAPERVRPNADATRSWQLLTFSAHSLVSLNAAVAEMAKYLGARPDVALADVAYTLNVGRAALRHRRIAVCRDAKDAQSVLAGAEPARVLANLQETLNPPVVFLFPGQGSQYPNMGLELVKTERTFRNCVDECAEILRPLLKKDIRSAIFADPSQLTAAESELQQTALTQPALFTVEYALARTWIDRGITPYALIGHSVGEYVAACLASVFSLEDALHLVALRGRLIQELPHGAMLSVALSADQMESYLNGRVSLAAINERNRCVISGPNEEIDAIASELKRRSIEFRRLHTSHAFHSAMLDPILVRFADAVAKVKRNPPALRCLSNVTGNWLTGDLAQDPGYWAQQMRQPVQFAQSLAQVFAEGPAILLEVGPGRTLTRFAKGHPERKREHVVVNSMRHPAEETSDVSTFLSALGQLWMHGVEVDWKDHWCSEFRRREPIPTYFFDRKRHWIDAALGSWSNPQDPNGHPQSPGAAEMASNFMVSHADQPAAARPDVSTPYAPPRTATESLFVQIWSELLGIGEIGIYDNFFELGGDSVLGVQVAGKANARGVRVSPKHLFDHQCIAELAAAVDAGLATEQTILQEAQGPQPLLPNQAWLLERMPEFLSWVSVTVLEAREPLDVAALEDTLHALREHHSALRTRFVTTGQGWLQEVTPEPQRQQVHWVDLSGLQGREFHAQVDDCARQARARVDLQKGEVLCMVAIRGNPRSGKQDRLIIAVHHWVQDQWGERILLHDLEEGYKQRRSGQSIQLLPTATSMSALASTLVRGAEGGMHDPRLIEWLRPTRQQVRALPWLVSSTAQRSSHDVSGLEKVLDEGETSRLLVEFQRLRRVTLEEVTASAATAALAAWSGERILLTDVLMSTRQVDLRGVDLTRSIGWFSTIYPLCVDLRDTSTDIDRLDAVVRGMRAVRHREHEYGMFRYLSSDTELSGQLANMPQADVFFAYFGNIDAPEAGYARGVQDGPFRVDPDATDMKRTMMGAFRYAVEIAVYLHDAQLHVAWLFNQTLLTREIADQIAESCMQNLRALIGLTSAVPIRESPPVFSVSTATSEHQLKDILAELDQS